VDYLQWIGTAAAFFFVTILVVAFLPGSLVLDTPAMPLPSRRASAGAGRTHPFLPPARGMDNGEGLAFEPTRLRERWARERREEADSLAGLGMAVKRAGARKPRLALVSCC
jgi:hypothetical protein